MALGASCQAGRANDRQGMQHRREGASWSCGHSPAEPGTQGTGSRGRDRRITRCALRAAEGA